MMVFFIVVDLQAQLFYFGYVTKLDKREKSIQMGKLFVNVLVCCYIYDGAESRICNKFIFTCKWL